MKDKNATDAPTRTPVRRVGLISLGCAKNLVDAEVMLGSLLRDGVEIVNDPASADALIINTCSFIDAAQEESVDAILESSAFRQRHRPDQAVIVSGCLPQRFRDHLPRLLPEVDAFMGIDQVEQVGGIVETALRVRAERRAAEEVAGSADTHGARRRSIQADMAALEASGAVLPDEETSTTRSRTKVRSAPGTAEGKVAQGRVQPEGSVPAAVSVQVRPNYVPHWDAPRFRLTPKHFAYVKIAEGCNHPCSFCIIPRMRGTHRSRAMADVIEEARRLIAAGVRELNLISQDTTYYGLDLRSGASRAIASPERFTAAARALPGDAPTLCALLRELNALPGEFWIRLLYTHPAHWTDELITTLAECPKVARYVDMPLQHIHDDLLNRMRRETQGDYIRDLIARIRAGIPGIALRTTFIVGFPGETRTHFETLLRFIRETRFERLGVFCYSQEEGTVAGRMASQVPMATRRRRRDRAMALQHEISREMAASQVGRRMRVLVEGPASDDVVRQAQQVSWEHGWIREDGAGETDVKVGRGYHVARGEADAPDIDGRVYVRGRLSAGEFAQVRIVGHTDYDLIAEPVRNR